MYKKVTKSDQTNVEGGYKQVVFWCPIADFLTVAAPAANPTTIGQRKKITTAHTFAAGNGFYGLLSKKHSVTTTAESTGDDGSQSFIHKFKFILLGDSESTLEQMEDMLNDNGLWLFKDQDCINTTGYVQFGDDCLQADHKISFDGKTTKEGLKEYTVEGSVKAKKFFYSGAVTEKPSTTSYNAPTVTPAISNFGGTPGTVLFLAVIAAAANNAPNQTLTYVWKKGGVVVAGATADFYVKANAQAADSGNYTCEATDAYGKTTPSSVITVTIQ